MLIVTCLTVHKFVAQSRKAHRHRFPSCGPVSLGARTRISVSFAFLHIFFTIDAFYLSNLTDILQISLLTKRWILYATIIEIKTLLSHAVFFSRGKHRREEPEGADHGLHAGHNLQGCCTPAKPRSAQLALCGEILKRKASTEFEMTP